MIESREKRNRFLSLMLYLLSSAIGVFAFLYPLLLPSIVQNIPPGSARSSDNPILITLLLGLCFIVLLIEVQSQAVSAKFVALLGVLVSINAVLRFVETGIPGPGGFSPVFFLIILTGYVFGGGFGFLIGALTLLVSAVVTGGMGPWLPGQMLAAGWVGLSSSLVQPLARLLNVERRRGEAFLLTAFAGVWGFAFGFIMNLWFWPFLSGPADQYWQPGITLSSTLQRYFAFYLTTSLVWDIIRAAGNVILMLAFGASTLRALRRFQQRFVYRYQPSPEGAVPAGGGS
jgi:energy-coupling factor transport system substrate-specific component